MVSHYHYHSKKMSIKDFHIDSDAQNIHSQRIRIKLSIETEGVGTKFCYPNIHWNGMHYLCDCLIFMCKIE